MIEAIGLLITVYLNFRVFGRISQRIEIMNRGYNPSSCDNAPFTRQGKPFQGGHVPNRDHVKNLTLFITL